MARCVSQNAVPACFLATCLTLLPLSSTAQTPSYTGVAQANLAYHDGRLRWAVGVQNVQVTRSAADNPSASDGNTTIYRHHPMIAYWGGRFWVMNQGQGTYISWSDDGLTWSPANRASFLATGSHFRMAFYVASNGRLLGINYWGDCNGCAGVHQVREIYGPNSFGPIYNIRSNDRGPGPGARLPLYSVSADADFVAACNQLLNDRLYRQQWQEEDQPAGGDFYTVNTNGGTTEWKAFAWYRRPDDRIVGTWKNNRMVVSSGTNWTPGNVPNPSTVSSFRWHTGAKIWGQRTEDGRFAMVGCASNGDNQRRWPVAVTTSSDGQFFTTPYLVIAGDIPVERYENDSGDDKNAGPQYVRGVCPATPDSLGNGNPPGSEMWLAYSMNKEDIWVARVPTPITGAVSTNVYDDFQGLVPGRHVPGWNTFSPEWAPVQVAQEQNNRFARLTDEDNCDYASVTRVFPKNNNGRLLFQVRALETDAPAPLEIDAVSPAGDRAVCLALNPATRLITAFNGTTNQTVGTYPVGGWVSFEIVLKGAGVKRYDLIVDGAPVLLNAVFLETADSDVERVTFRTGAFRLRDFYRRPHTEPFLTDRIVNADVRQPPSRYDIDNVVLVTNTVAVSSPAIVSNPSSRTNNAGTEAVFTVNAIGHGLSYQWRIGAQDLVNGGNVAGANAASLRLTAVSQADAGSYSVMVSNAVGPAVTSATATLTVLDYPATPGALTVLASNSLVRLSWKAVPGATGYKVQRSTTNGGPYMVLGITPATSYDDTAVRNGFVYHYVVTAINGPGESLPSTQGMALPPMEDFRTDPTVRGWTSINGSISGGNNFGWSSGSANVLGPGNEGELGGVFARSATIRYYAQTNLGGVLSRTNAFSFSGSLRLANEDFNGSFFIGLLDRTDTSSPIPMYGLEISEPDSGGVLSAFRVQPKIRTGAGTVVAANNIYVAQKTTAFFSVTWTGNPNGSGTLSGSVAGTAFSISDGARTESLNAFGIGVGFMGNDDSTLNTAGVYFDNLSYSLVPPRITSQPTGRTNAAGTSATFAVTASGLSLYYQWWKGAQMLTNGGNVSGADSPTLTLASVSQTDAGNYRVEVRNVSGSATSWAAILTIIDLSPTPPALWFDTTPPGYITLHWSGSGFVLQQNPDLSNPAAWVNAPSGTNIPAVVPIAADSLFYRLKWPQ